MPTVSQDLNNVCRILSNVLATTLVELRIRGLREFQCKGERQILKIDGQSLVIDQTALENTNVLGRREFDRICQETREVIVDDRIGTQWNLNLGGCRDDVVVQRRGLHRNFIIDLQELVISSRDIGNGRGDHRRGGSQIRGNRCGTAESQQLAQPKILGTRRPTDSIGSHCILTCARLEDQGKRRVIRRICNCKFTQIGVLGQRPCLSSSCPIQCRFDGRLQSRKILVAICDRDQLVCG